MKKIKLFLYYDFCNNGALTSKSYAFKARSWELKKIQTLDIFDNDYEFIRVDIRNSIIMRILPISNEQWITDKMRFAFDGFFRWRLTNPLVAFRTPMTVDYKIISWVKAFEIFKNKLTINGITNKILAISGNFNDLQTVVLFKHFFKRLGYNTNLKSAEKGYVNSDMRESFYLSPYFYKFLEKLDDSKIIIIISNNLRLDLPLVYLKLRQSVLSTNTKIYTIGNSVNNNILINNLGNNLGILYALYKGKHYLCKYYLLNKYARFFLLISDNVLRRKDFCNLVESLNLTNKYVFTNFIYTNNNDVNLKEIAFDNTVSLQENYNVYDFIYLLNSNFHKSWTFFQKKPFIVFQGHHIDQFINTKNTNRYFIPSIDLILPTTIYYENNKEYYISNKGIINTTNQLINRDTIKYNIKESNIIIKALLNYILENNIRINYNKEAYNLITKNLYKHFSEVYLKFIYKTVIYKSLLVNYNLNYYKQDNISISSKIMTLSSIRFLKKHYKY